VITFMRLLCASWFLASALALSTRVTRIVTDEMQSDGFFSTAVGEDTAETTSNGRILP